MINQNSTNDIDFSLFSQKELSQQSQISELINLAEKYGMLEIENQFVSAKDKSFLYLINYIYELEDKHSIPKDIEDIFLNNIFLKEQVNSFLEKKLYSLLNDAASEFSKNINILTSILAIGANDKILDSTNELDFISIYNLFRFYEFRLKELYENNIELFNVTFQSYLILLKMFIHICAINSINLKKTREIIEIIDLLTETINIIKFTIFLKDEDLSKINNLQGKCLYYFSHLDAISFDENEIELTLKKYLLIFEKQEDGFILTKNNHFGYETSIFENDEFMIFRNYSSILLLILINELETLEPHLYINNDYYKKIVNKFYNLFLIDSIEKDSYEIESFKKHLINSFLIKYNSNLSLERKLSIYFIIEDFILTYNDFDNKNLETIFRILYFTNNIEDFKFSQIIQILVNSSKIVNNHYEFYKLQIFDLFIERFINEKNSSKSINLIIQIYNYLKRNNFDFNLEYISNRLINKLDTKNILKNNKNNSDLDSSNETNKKSSIKYDLLDDDYEINF